MIRSVQYSSFNDSSNSHDEMTCFSKVNKNEYKGFF